MDQQYQEPVIKYKCICGCARHCGQSCQECDCCPDCECELCQQGKEFN
jgi:hypothetical protein